MNAAKRGLLTISSPTLLPGSRSGGVVGGRQLPCRLCASLLLLINRFFSLSPEILAIMTPYFASFASILLLFDMRFLIAQMLRYAQTQN